MSGYSRAYEVAIFSYGDGPALHRCLERVALLLERHPGGTATLYAVDDGQGLASVQELCRASGISLVLEPRRLGKAHSVASAILHAQAPVVLLVGGDGVPCLDAPAVALDALSDPGVGGIGGRNVPVNADESMVARAMALLWELHDRVNMLKPKLGGDMVAVRVAPVAGRPLLSVDDASLEALLVKQGLRIVYRPDFFVQMRVPTTLRDAVLQRRRLAAQYRQLEQAHGAAAAELAAVQRTGVARRPGHEAVGGLREPVVLLKGPLLVGLGIPDRESIIVQCQQLLAIFCQMFSIGVPVVSAQNVYNVIVKMLNAMNIKNVNDYVSNPQVTQGLSQVYHLILPMIGQNPQLAGQVSSIFAMAGVPVKEIQQAVSAAMTPEQTGSESPEQATQPAQPVNPRTARPVNGYYP